MAKNKKAFLLKSKRLPLKSFNLKKMKQKTNWQNNPRNKTKKSRCWFYACFLVMYFHTLGIIVCIIFILWIS